jgi:hypothetical protein
VAACGVASGQPTVPPGAAGYYGSGVTQPFNEKALFPPNASAVPGRPADPPPTLVPDGSLPPPPPPKLWTGGIEFGVNGSQGNTDVLNARFGLNADRRTEHNFFHADVLYTLTRQDGTTNQNQAWLNARDEILFPNSPWSIFAATQVEYNEFRAYNFRVGAYTGLAYQWLRTETTLVKTRLGAGAAWQTDTRHHSPDRWVPEAILGVDFNRRLTDRQALISTIDAYPNLSQIGQYRLRARVGYEVVIDPAHGMVLRLGVQDWYDTNPGPAARNDVNYFVSLLFKF